MMNKLIAVFFCLFSCSYSFSIKAKNQSEEIDKLVLKTMAAFNVPGVAVGIIKDGKIHHLKGYGQSNIETKAQVNQDTLFKIASNTKAFTSAALALLVDDGKLKWSDKVNRYLPEFKMKDPWVTKEFNIRDLLTHRSGLRIGAGDLMLWPEPTKFTRKGVINNLRYLESVGSFRDEYAYDNLLYIVAGEVVAKISGMPWESFVKKRIFKKLNMNQCFAGSVDALKVENLAAPHAIVDNSLVMLHKNRINDKTSLMAAAGGIKCSAKNLLMWVGMLLNQGRASDGKKLLSQKQIRTLWQPVTSLPISNSMKVFDETTYRSYALGWRISNYHGEHRVSHTGTLSGFMSQIIMLPSLKLGIIILTNQQSSSARNALARGLMNIELNQLTDKGQKWTKDWVEYYVTTNKKRNIINQTSSKLKTNFERKILNKQYKYLGSYKDLWFGKISLTKEGGSVIFKSEMSPRMIGKIYFHNGSEWWVKWNDRSFEADARLIFSKNKEGAIEMRMKAISSKTDFSFDFQDLHFNKR